jgi:ferredoxin-NADP reductase
MKLTVTRRIILSDNVVEFQLRFADGSALPAWEAGAHLALTLPGFDNPSPVRHYSLVGDPEVRDIYRIAVLLNANGQGGSRYMHEHLQLGALLEVSGPFHTFSLAKPVGRTVLLAGGIGVTPLLSMAHALSRLGYRFELHYVARTAAHMVLLDEFRSIPGCSIATYRTDSTGVPDLADILGSYETGTVVHACGPVPMLQAMKQRAADLDWPADAVRVESFGARQQQQDRPVTVHLALSDMRIDVMPGTPILDALIDAGMFVSYECRRGECGHCFTPVVDGVASHRDVCLSPQQRREGMCTCVSWAESDTLVLDL